MTSMSEYEDDFPTEDAAEAHEVETDNETTGVSNGTDDAETGATTETGEAAEPVAEATNKAAEEKAAKEAEEKAGQESLEAFKTQVNELVNSEKVDKSTGTVPDGEKSAVRLAYSRLPGTRFKTQGKNWLQEQMHLFMEKYDPSDPATAANAVLARSFLHLFNEVRKGAVRSESPVAKPVDPTEEYVARIASALIAPNLMLTPDGVAEDWRTKAQDKVTELTPQVQTYRQYLGELAAATQAGKTGEDLPEEPEVDEIVKAAARMAAGRANRAARATTRKPREASGSTSTPYTGARRNIATHISEAFKDHPVGTWLSNADIAKFVSSEYPDPSDRPSTGAIAGQLFPKNGDECKIPGIRGEVRDIKGGLKYAEA